MKRLHMFKVLSFMLVLSFMFVGYFYLTEKSESCFKKAELNNIKNLNVNEVKKVTSISKVLRQLNKDKNICILNIKKDKDYDCVKISYNGTLINLKEILNNLYNISNFKSIKQLDIKEENNNINTYLEVEFYPEFT